MDMPEFMKLMECECGWTLYSIYAQPQECPKCYEMIDTQKKLETDEAREFLIERDHERKI